MGRRVVLITFSIRSRSFDSDYERNRFYRELYGWKQTVRRGDSKYVYERPGLLNEIPNIRVDQSLFLIAKRYFEEVEDFFREWKRKVLFNAFELSPEDNINRAFAKRLLELEEDI